MSQIVQVESSSSQAQLPRLDVTCAYLIEGLSSLSGCLLMIGIPFYTTQRFGWSSGQNLLLMMAQGIAYTAGALSAGPLARRARKTHSLIGVNAGLVLLALAISLSSTTAVLIPLLLAYVFVGTLTWPLIESLITEGCDPIKMNRRVTGYNLVWSAMNVIVIGLYGTVLRAWPAGPLVIPAVSQSIAVCAAVILAAKHRQPAGTAAAAPHGDPQVAARLASSRRMAMWLSRISLPASFVAANGLMAVFPTMKISTEIGVALASLLASTWMIGRFATFILLGVTNFWHTRPRLLLYGSALMLFSFLAIVVPAERFGLFGQMPLWMIVTIVVVAELVFGVVAGFVCSASLYFGMVLSDGSTEHGSYHEALIGVGVVVGPGLAAGAQQFAAPGSNWPGVAAVVGLMVLTLAFASFAAARFRGNGQD